MNQRRAMPLFAEAGFYDSDAQLKRATIPARLPVFGLDYAFHNDGLVLEDFQVLPARGASDHKPIVGTYRAT